LFGGEHGYVTKVCGVFVRFFFNHTSSFKCEVLQPRSGELILQEDYTF
jgi:hypothetical protein